VPRSCQGSRGPWILHYAVGLYAGPPVDMDHERNNEEQNKAGGAHVEKTEIKITAECTLSA